VFLYDEVSMPETIQAMSAALPQTVWAVSANRRFWAQERGTHPGDVVYRN